PECTLDGGPLDAKPGKFGRVRRAEWELTDSGAGADLVASGAFRGSAVLFQESASVQRGEAHKKHSGNVGPATSWVRSSDGDFRQKSGPSSPADSAVSDHECTNLQCS